MNTLIYTGLCLIGLVLLMVVFYALVTVPSGADAHIEHKDEILEAIKCKSE